MNKVMENRAKERIQDQVEELKDAYAQERQSATELARTAVATSREAVFFADSWVRYNAWKLLGISIGVGLLMGLLLSSGSKKSKPQRVPR